MKVPAVYVISNMLRTTIYIGVTSNLERRMLEHKAGVGSSYAKKYKLHVLLYYEKAPSMIVAIAREKQLKNWHKDWKWNLVKKFNPELKDIAANWFRKDEVVAFKENWIYEHRDC